MRELGAMGGAGGVTRSDCAGIPSVSRNIVEGHAFTLFVKEGQIGFGRRQALLSGESKQASGLGVIERDAQSLEIEIGETALGIRRARGSSSAKPTDGLRVIARGAGGEAI